MDETPLPSFDAQPFGLSPFTKEEEDLVQQFLEQQLPASDIEFRDGPAGLIVPYVAFQSVVNEANLAFGVDGWSTSVAGVTQDYLEESEGKYYCGVSSIVKVTLRDGSFREDIGYGSSEGQSPAEVIAKSRKIAVTDALKRCLRQFGSRMGNCLGDKTRMQTLAEKHLALREKKKRLSVDP